LLKMQFTPGRRARVFPLQHIALPIEAEVVLQSRVIGQSKVIT